ncbi:MAG: glycoside hydrolase family 3 protein, partial [Acidimicrobiia bacterium]
MGAKERLERIEKLLEELTVTEAAELVSGMTLWYTHPVPRLGILGLKMSDGPGGVRGEYFGDGPPSRSSPCSAALASTWDADLVESIGVELGKEARSKRVHVHLAPTVNIQRTPIGGRNFECFSEDPELSARMAVAFVRGVQSQGVASTVKHFAGNDQEFERFTISCVIDPRTLREVYLRPFEAACIEAGAWAVMAAYNKLNGVFCTEHSELLDDILRKDWGWDGAVVSDWRATHSTKECASVGLDIEMPGPPMVWGKALAEAVDNGEVSETALRAKARNVLNLMERTGAFNEREPETYEEDSDRDALLRRAASAGMVLLRNEVVGESPLLPISSETDLTVAVIGP